MKTIVRYGNIVYYLLAALLVASLFSGCNTAARLAKKNKQFEDAVNAYIAAHPPRIDTSTVYIQGRTDTVPVFIPVPDENKLQQVKDSLQKALYNKYADKQQDCNRQVNEAFNTGYEQARYEMQQAFKSKPARVDTFLKIVYNTDAVNNLQKIVAVKTALLTKAESETKKWLLWCMISIAVNALLLFLLIKHYVK